MGALLGFVPFIVFALVEKFAGVAAALACAALASFVLLARHRLRGEREINLLEAGSASMFTALAGLALIYDSHAWSIWQVRLAVDSGLLLIVLLSIAVQRPFTLQHARHQVSAEVARSAGFLRTNTIVSAAWALAITTLVVADLLMVLRPDAPSVIAIALTLSTLAAAAAFTRWYAGRVQRRAEASCFTTRTMRSTSSQVL